MSIEAEDSDKKEYDTQLLETIVELIALLNERFESVHETGITLDNIEIEGLIDGT